MTDEKDDKDQIEDLGLDLGDDFINQMFMMQRYRGSQTKMFKNIDHAKRFEQLGKIIEDADKTKLATSIKYSAGSNFDALIFCLISKAQSTPENYYRLRMGFPDYVELWEEWQNTENEGDFFNKYGVK